MGLENRLKHSELEVDQPGRRSKGLPIVAATKSDLLGLYVIKGEFATELSTGLSKTTLLSYDFSFLTFLQLQGSLLRLMEYYRGKQSLRRSTALIHVAQSLGKHPKLD